MMYRGTVRNMYSFIPKIKFEKLVHLFGFVIRIYHVARSPERQIQFSELYLRQSTLQEETVQHLRAIVILHMFHFAFIFSKCITILTFFWSMVVKIAKVTRLKTKFQCGNKHPVPYTKQCSKSDKCSVVGSYSCTQLTSQLNTLKPDIFRGNLINPFRIL